jgi:2-polyprenyl-3-methyl-5-hydroxy-6-metoxy-1,4-benzoquinol methylase
LGQQNLKRYGIIKSDGSYLIKIPVPILVIAQTGKEEKMAAYYNTIAQEHKQSKELPYRLYIEEYTYFNLLGDLAGKSILDLGCGEGFYTRKFRQKGAIWVVGIDISKKLIEMARQEEARQSLGIECLK